MLTIFPDKVEVQTGNWKVNNAHHWMGKKT